MPGGQRHVPKPRPAAAGGSLDESSIADVIRPVVAAAGMDLESVRVSTAGRRRLLRVVVDGDRGVSLDDAAIISRDVSAALDATDVMGDVPYTLEVSSPGVDRPLTEPRHWRRAAGRLVRVRAGAAGTIEGRVLATDAEGVTIDANGARRQFAYPDLGAGAVQVEFGRADDTDDMDLEELDSGVSDLELPYEADLGAGGDGH